MASNRTAAKSASASPDSSEDPSQSMISAFQTSRKRLQEMSSDLGYFKLVWGNDIKPQLLESKMGNDSAEQIVKSIREYDVVDEELTSKLTRLESDIDAHLLVIQAKRDELESNNRIFAGRNRTAGRREADQLQKTTKELKAIVAEAIDNFKNQYIGTPEYNKFDNEMSAMNKLRDYKWIFDPKTMNSAEWEKDRLTEYLNTIFDKLYQLRGTHPLVQSLLANIPEDKFAIEGLVGAKKISFKAPKASSPSASKASEDAATMAHNEKQEAQQQIIRMETELVKTDIQKYSATTEELESYATVALLSPYTVYQDQIQPPALAYQNQLESLEKKLKDVVKQVRGADYLDAATKVDMLEKLQGYAKKIDDTANKLARITDSIDTKKLSGRSLVSAFIRMKGLPNIINDNILNQFKTEVGSIETALSEKKTLVTTIFERLENVYMEKIEANKRPEIKAIFAECKASAGTDVEKVHAVLEKLTNRGSKTGNREAPKATRLFTPSSSIKKTTYELFRSMDGSGKDKPNLEVIKAKVSDPAQRAELLQKIDAYAGPSQANVAKTPHK
jgi:hypothetical protein